MDLKIEKIVVGSLETNCYLLSDKKSALIIDPGDEAEKISKSINGKRMEYILLTHGHYDHLLALNFLAKKYPQAKICLGEKEISLCRNFSLQSDFTNENLSDLSLNFVGLGEGEGLSFAGETITVFETPGHTDGGVCFSLDGVLFSGDTLFRGAYGRTDLPTGNQELMNKSLIKLAKFNDEIIVYPGHGPETTIGNEKRFGFLA